MSLEINQSFNSIAQAYPILKQWSHFLSQEKSHFSIEKNDPYLILKISGDSTEELKIKSLAGSHFVQPWWDCCPLGSDVGKDYTIEILGEDSEGRQIKFSAEAFSTFTSGRHLPAGGLQSFSGKCKLEKQ